MRYVFRLPNMTDNSNADVPCVQATNTFPKDIANKVRADESLVPKGDKKAMQKVMPFLQFVAAEVCRRPKSWPLGHLSVFYGS